MKIQINRNEWHDRLQDDIEAEIAQYSKPVILLGMAETSRTLAPFHLDVPIWTLNEAPFTGDWCLRWDRLFQIHHDWDFLRGYHSEFRSNHNFGRYPEWLLSEEEFADRPARQIIMQEEFPQIAGAKKYPLDEIIDSYEVNSENVRYLTSTFPYMVALAIDEGFDWIGCFGWEMSTGTEYGAQRPSASLWLGIAMGKGIKVYLPPGSHLLGGGLKLYGFENEPRVGRSHIEIQYAGALKVYKKAEEERNQLIGERTILMKQIENANPGKRAKIMKKIEELGKRLLQNMAVVNSSLGAKSSLKRQLQALDQLPTTDDLPVLMPKFEEIDEELLEETIKQPKSKPKKKRRRQR